MNSLFYRSSFLLTCITLSSRTFASTASTKMESKKVGLLLGAFESNINETKTLALTNSASKFDSNVSGKLTKLLNITGPVSKGKTQLFYDVSTEFPVVVVVGLGSTNASFNELEGLHENHENVRSAVATGARTLREQSVDEILVDDCHDAQAAAEGGTLGLYYYDDLKSQKNKKRKVKLTLWNANETTTADWERGIIIADGQNLARHLAETPANLMTPTIFCDTVTQLAKPLGINVTVHDVDWAEKKKMGSFLSVTHGSDEPAKFLEMSWNNAPGTKPIVLVGKGITFDSGGISIKPSSGMDLQRADMHGAASVVSTLITLAKLKAPVNVVVLTPLTENLISGKATKPGDVVFASNGKSVQIDNTDAEGRLVLADALHYAHEFDPQLILDIATLTGAIKVALGSAVSGVFSTSTRYYNLLQEAGSLTGDRVWRFPLLDHYTKMVTDPQLADLLNMSKQSGGHAGACVAAAFLREFVTNPNWIHIDMAGVKWQDSTSGYNVKGMSGRPVRTLVRFVQSAFSTE